jgi:hypothetical protein
VRSKGRYYDAMAEHVEPFVNAGGPAAAKAARFLSVALDRLFHEKLARQQHVLMEAATSIVEVETAVALVRRAGMSSDSLLVAQARVWASDVALSAPLRLAKAFAASGVADLRAAADLDGAMAMQSGRLADLDFIARAITA